MSGKLYGWDAADALKSKEAIEIFLADALETGDASHIGKALEVADRAKQALQTTTRRKKPPRV